MPQGPSKLLRFLFFTLLVRPLVLLVLGLNVRDRDRLPTRGPAIVVANHNSHLDTLVVMTLFRWGVLESLRPAAAADYFLRNRALAWFALRVIGILPLQRGGFGHRSDPLAGCAGVLEAGGILLLFPEGSRGEPERIGQFRSGVAHLAARFPEVPVVPLYMHGLGKALPRGEAILVPFFCDVFVGESLRWTGDRAGFMGELNGTFQRLAEAGRFPSWE